jgi:hypothetical protein
MSNTDKLTEAVWDHFVDVNKMIESGKSYAATNMGYIVFFNPRIQG